MLKIIVPGEEYYDEKLESFSTVGDFTLELEHSLAALSKWEQKWEKPFLGLKEPTNEELLYYLKSMAITPDVPEIIWNKLSSENVKDINEYINRKMTATWFREDSNLNRSSEIITADIIYYWMITFNIPLDCENWHLSRLFTLIKTYSAKQTKEKKLSPKQLAEQRSRLNAERKAKLGTTG